MFSTARILCEGRRGNFGQNCVDWAVSRLEEGRDGYYLAMLAGMSPPYNGFEIDALLKRALRELDVPNLSPSAAVWAYAAECLQEALSAGSDKVESLGIVVDLYVDHDYPRELYALYRLHYAHRELMDYGHQFYWEGANYENIDRIIDEKIEAFLRDAPKV